MIFKDHVQWPGNDENAKKEYDFVVDKLTEAAGGRFPIKLVWDKSRVTKNPKSPIPNKPAPMPIFLNWPAPGIGAVGSKQEKEAERAKKHIWVYADNFTPGQTVYANTYVPNAKSFSGYMSFEKDNIEFLVYLFIAYPQLNGGLNSKEGSQNEIQFDTPHVEMKKNIEYDKLLTSAKRLIQDREFGLPIEKVRSMLTSYFVPDVDKMEDWEVEAKMTAIVEAKDKKDAEKLAVVKLFIARNGDEEGVRARFLIQKAIEKKLLEFDAAPTKRYWHLIVEGKRLSEGPICKVPIDQDPNQTLYEYLNSEGKGTLNLIEKSLFPKSEKKKSAEEPEK